MKVVVGLGNPGAKYERTRHNAGFWVIARLAEKLSITGTKEKWSAIVGETFVSGEKVLLVQPLTFMNKSGDSVRQIVEYFPQIKPASDIVVIYDDMDLPPGVIRLRQQGSSGGHNGMKSIVNALREQSICRIRIGIGRPDKQDVIDYVLQRPGVEDEQAIEESVNLAVEAVVLTLNSGFQHAMNKYN
ncbi:aminoacyl-tRNA hydrolase [Alicyclobacillus sp. SO9]|uniref:aminoacyl-tRNA hydrolase n=1 Tax=Alicyclobacillus sp. SO9 TaxID=2665646 RepID=UPI0018E7BCE3|nr:aminoacyl-tRNA hydrolase [Alicyclobacillus sp. SO9]QQE79407.1 aminoacyl-tRNA hydrolase [Alicyclobacillus sp. SO9]